MLRMLKLFRWRKRHVRWTNQDAIFLIDNNISYWRMPS
jgi:hypothetical protein